MRIQGVLVQALTRYFCTYFDSRYLIKGLALYSSLKRHCPGFVLYVLCLDERTHAVLSKLAYRELRLIRLADFEAANPDLLAVKSERTFFEYYCTLTPCLATWVLDNAPRVDMLTYVDADLYFFSSPEPLFAEVAQGSTLIIEHRNAPDFAHYTPTNGIYNVGWLTFRRDEDGLACLRWWRQRCIEWCFLRAEDGKFADQKYLDEWPERFDGVVVSALKGANVAPWNV